MKGNDFIQAICKMLLKSLPQNIFTVFFSRFAFQGFGLIEINHIVIVSVFHFWNRWFPKYQRYFDIVLQNVALWVLVMLFISADILRNKTAPKFSGIRKVEKFWCKFYPTCTNGHWYFLQHSSSHPTAIKYCLSVSHLIWKKSKLHIFKPLYIITDVLLFLWLL